MAESRTERPPDPADDAPFPGRRRIVVAAAFGVIAVLVASDVVTDSWAGVPLLHLLIEVAVVASAAAGMAIVLREWSLARRAARALRADAVAARGDARRWRRRAEEHAAGLSALIDQQFDAWALSEAERAVALLLLKGLSHKEVAAVRGTSERTAREQALALYRKAGLSGRAELAAFFLEDLLDPARASPRDRGLPPPA